VSHEYQVGAAEALGCERALSRQAPGRTLKNEADHYSTLKQERYKQKAFNSHVDPAAYARLPDMLVGEIKLPVRPDAVHQMWKLQVLLHREPITADVRVLCVDGTKPAIAK
jgi:hypothetical protein